MLARRHGIGGELVEHRFDRTGTAAPLDIAGARKRCLDPRLHRGHAGLCDLALKCRECGVIAIKEHRHHAPGVGRPHQQPSPTRAIERRQQIPIPDGQCLPARRRRDEEPRLTGTDSSGQPFKCSKCRSPYRFVHGRMPTREFGHDPAETGRQDVVQRLAQDVGIHPQAHLHGVVDHSGENQCPRRAGANRHARNDGVAGIEGQPGAIDVSTSQPNDATKSRQH